MINRIVTHITPIFKSRFAVRNIEPRNVEANCTTALLI